MHFCLFFTRHATFADCTFLHFKAIVLFEPLYKRRRFQALAAMWLFREVGKMLFLVSFVGRPAWPIFFVCTCANLYVNVHSTFHTNTVFEMGAVIDFIFLEKVGEKLNFHPI